MDPKLIEWLASVTNDPFAYVMGAFPWGEEGTSLEKDTGPNDWQVWVLSQIRDGSLSIAEAIQIAVASGHGVGKSTLVAWIIKWAADTAPDTRGVVTANTENQLKTKTWAELGKWHNLSITREHFEVTATAYFSKDKSRERTWRIDAVPWSEKNTEAFAGLHNKGKRLLLIMDEASAIFDLIWEVAEGAMTDADTQIIWLAFGNPTRNTGRFRECFSGGRFAKYWRSRAVDSRTVPQTNKVQIQKWIDAYGEDSDFVRIRVKGEFPSVGEMEFFSADDIEAAATREAHCHYTDPLALGVDVARYGKNNSVIWPRKGRDARTFERKRFQGIPTDVLADRVAETNATLRADGIMVDGGGVGGGVVDFIRRKRLHCYEVQFGARDTVPHMIFGSDGEKYANERSGLYGALRAWLKTGAIPDDPDIKAQFKAIKYTFNKKDEIQLIAKDDIEIDAGIGLDDIDALATTFATAIERSEYSGGEHPARSDVAKHEYDPLSDERMSA